MSGIKEMNFENKLDKVVKNNKRSTFAIRKSLILILLLVILLIFNFLGCGNQVASNNMPKTTTKIVVDCIGRKVEIPNKVERVGCLYAFAGHITALVGEEDKIVAVVDGLKRDKLLLNMFPDILEKTVPFTEGSINIEELVKLNPDIVFIRESTADNLGEMEKLAAFNIPALVVDSNTIKEQRDSVLLLGEVFGGSAKEKAMEYDKIYQNAIDIATEKSSQINPEQIVSIFHSINEATRTDERGTISAEWTQIVGVNNVSVNKDLNALEGKMYAGLEQIYLWDPQMIICNEAGVSEYILNDSKWSGLQAVRNNMVYQMPVAISRWGHPGSMETPLAIYWLGKLAYPEIYKDVDLILETKSFYQTFFNYALSDEEVTLILSGEGLRKGKSNETTDLY